MELQPYWRALTWKTPVILSILLCKRTFISTNCYGQYLYWILAFCKWFSSLALRSLWTKSKYIDCIRGTKCKYISMSLVPGMFADSMCKVSIVFEWTCKCIKLRMNGPIFQGRRRTNKNRKQIWFDYLNMTVILTSRGKCNDTQ